MSGRQSVPAKPVVIHSNKSRLAKLIDRPGGTARHLAIEEATKQLELLRDEAVTALDMLIAQVAATQTMPERAGSERMREVLTLSNQIITIAGTFGLSALMEAAMRLCDLTQAFLARELDHAEPIAVHVRALQLFGPTKPDPGPDASRNVLAELRRVLAHFDIVIPDQHTLMPAETAERT